MLWLVQGLVLLMCYGWFKAVCCGCFKALLWLIQSLMLLVCHGWFKALCYWCIMAGSRPCVTGVSWLVQGFVTGVIWLVQGLVLLVC